MTSMQWLISRIFGVFFEHSVFSFLLYAPVVLEISLDNQMTLGVWFVGVK